MSNKSWPHPVLDSEGTDYPSCAFQAMISVSQQPLAYRVDTRFDIGSESICAAIAKGNAEYSVQVSCPRTAYRKSYQSKSPTVTFEIPEPQLRDNFTVSPFVVAKRDFEYTSEEFADLFSGISFQIEAGSVLAISPSVDYFAEKQFDTLEKVSAVFQVVRDPSPNASGIDYNFESEKIEILLAPSLYSSYLIFRNRKPYSQVFICSLVLPGLVLALQQLLGQPDLSKYRWQRAIRKKVEAAGKRDAQVDDASKLAQLLLDGPFGRMFEAITEKESGAEAE